MSKDAKLFTRPKVRFTQNVECEDTARNLKASCEQKTGVRANGPKIKSIVSLKKPVKILHLEKVASESKNDEPCSAKDKGRFELVAERDDAPSSEMLRPVSPLRDHTATVDKEKRFNGIKNVHDNSDDKDVPKIPNVLNKVQKDVPPLVLPVLKDNVPDNKVYQGTKNREKNVANGSQRNKRGKENEGSVVNRNVGSTLAMKKDGTSKASKTTFKEKFEIHSINPGMKKSSTAHPEKIKSTNMSSRKSFAKDKVSLSSGLSAARNTSRSLSTKSTMVNVMPCHKYNRMTAKTKTSPVKKTVVRDMIGHKTKACVGPGMSRKKPESRKIPEDNKNVGIKTDESGEKLARPEYNSIMCTINKLNEVQRQKVVTDIEHLPTAYRNLVNEKISAALDFPLDEAIYKNLVDLSIDDKQFPSRLKRSKDPTPRQRDLVPVLSDFFKPTSTEEYCTSISIKPRTPEITESWNAFRISNKIVEWKQSVDHGL